MRNKEELYQSLELSLKELKSNRQVLQGVKDGLLKYGVFKGETQKIFMGETPLKSLSEQMLILLTEEIHRHSSVFDLNPYGFFSVKEVKDAKSKKVETSNENYSFPVVLHNVIQKEDDSFVAFVKAKFLVGLYNSNILKYNYNINKQYKLINKHGKLIQALDINTKEIREIAEKIINNTYDMSRIVLNTLLGSAKTPYELRFESGKLTIFESQVDIINGLKDLSALAYVLEAQPNTQLKVEVEIKNYDMDKITTFFNQLNLKGGVN